MLGRIAGYLDSAIFIRFDAWVNYGCLVYTGLQAMCFDSGVQQFQEFASVDFVVEGGSEGFGAVFNVFFRKGC